MVEPRRRPAPRTLSATPPPPARVPLATLARTRFPSLVAVIAGGALVPACHAPECGDTRADELTAHGAASMRAVRRGEASTALQEIAVALGVSSHASTATRIRSPGEAPVTTTTPRPEVPVVAPSGAAPAVQPTPLEEPPLTAPGRVRAVDPTPPTPPTPQQHSTRPHRPDVPRPAVPGGLGVVSPIAPPQRPAEAQGGLRAISPAPADTARR